MFQEILQDTFFEHIVGLVSRIPFIFVGGVPGVCSNLLSGAAGSSGWYKSTSCFSWTSGSREVGVGRLAGGLNRFVCFNFHPYLPVEMIQVDVLSQRGWETPPTGKISVHPPLFILHENLGCQIFGWVDFLVKSEVLVRSYRGCERWMDV